MFTGITDGYASDYAIILYLLYKQIWFFFKSKHHETKFSSV